MEPAKNLAEDGTGDDAIVRHVVSGQHLEDRRSGDRAQGEQAADPEGESHNTSKPQREHRLIIIRRSGCPPSECSRTA